MLWMVYASFSILLHQARCILIQNPGFEMSNTTGLAMWHANGGKIAFNTYHAHGGKLTMKSYSRFHDTDGVGQYISLQSNTRYAFSVYVMQFNDRQTMQTFTASVTYTWHDDSRPETRTIARQPYVERASGWFQMEGCFMVPNKKINKAFLSIQGPEPHVDFAVDDFSLKEIPEDKNWEVEANRNIRKWRTNKMHFIITAEQYMNPADITIQIDHTRHLFGFGADVIPIRDTDPRFRSYHHFFATSFNWATVNHLGWPASVTNNCYFEEDYPIVSCVNGFPEDFHDFTSSLNYDYITAIKASLELKKNGVSLRANSMLGNPPAWVKHLSGSTLDQNVSQRIQYMTRLTKGLYIQWDVFDNTLDDQVYERQTGDHQYIQKAFKMMQHADPAVEFVLNEHDVVMGGYNTKAYTKLAEDLKPHGLNGIGTKSQISNIPADPTLLGIRLNRLRSTGLPVWITDFAVADRDVNIRANQLEKMLRFYFSHPSVEGIMFKGPWDRNDAPPYTSLFNGDNYKANAAGIRYQRLVNSEWSTHVKRTLSQGRAFTIDGYHGEYNVDVYYKGGLVQRKEIELGKSDLIVQMHIEETFALTMPTTHPPTPTTKPPVIIDTLGQHPIGIEISTATNPDLKCVSRRSNVSASSKGAVAEVGCQGDEVLTGCSSLKRAHTGDLSHNGQIFVKSGNDTVCQAQNGDSSNGGVVAEARCCMTKGISCAYRGAGPSRLYNGAMVQTNCPHNYFAIGCTVSQGEAKVNGAYPWSPQAVNLQSEVTKRLASSLKGNVHSMTNPIECMAVNGGASFGALSAAACCHSPGITCVTVESKPSDIRRGNETSVTCDSQAQYVMTSCQARCTSGGIGGTTIRSDSIKGDACVAVNGVDKNAGEDGVTAVAVCCRVPHNTPVVHVLPVG